MGVEESRAQSSQSGASTEPRLVKDMPNESPNYDDAEEWVSCVTESIPYDMHDALSWNDQVIDMDYASLFRDVFEFNLSSVQPK